MLFAGQNIMEPESQGTQYKNEVTTKQIFVEDVK
jgi:hypothetical protein